MFKQINIDNFKDMFAAYCHNEVEAGRCEPDNCLWCAVNMAWDRIFCVERENEDW